VLPSNIARYELQPWPDTFPQHLAESVYKGVTIGIVPKDFPALDCTHDDVVKRTRSINSGFSWHTKYQYQAN
jgi:hypothetical protein